MADLPPLPRWLRLGARGRDVLALERALRRGGFLPKGYRADRLYDEETEAAVRAFQKASGLVVDGVVGPQTYGALAPFYDARGRWLIAQVRPLAPDPGAPLPDRAGVRRRIVLTAHLGVEKNELIRYTQGRRRMEGVRRRILPPDVPTWEDCSSFRDVVLLGRRRARPERARLRRHRLHRDTDRSRSRGRRAAARRPLLLRPERRAHHARHALRGQRARRQPRPGGGAGALRHPELPPPARSPPVPQLPPVTSGRLCYTPAHMGNRVGVRELRQNLSRYLDRVRAGEALIVTEHGREVARLVPSTPGAYAELATSFGATVPTRDLLEIAARLPPRSAPGGTTDAFLEESRASPS